MNSNYPQMTKAVRTGEIGVNMVAKIATDDFGWIFKRNPQEYDFGIDGQLEVVTDLGSVTGQIAAVQIKCGPSFFSEKNKWGFVYRGEKKHFNYLSAYPTIVLIVLCDPSTGECYWVKFDPESTVGTTKGWKITIPFENKLSESKGQILQLLPEMRDVLSEIEEYWKINELLVESSFNLFIFDRDEVEQYDSTRIRIFFDHLRSTKELAYSCMGTIEFSISGYDQDPRELFEIVEVVNFYKALNKVIPEILFFLRSKGKCYTLPVIAACVGNAVIQGKRATPGTQHKIVSETKPIAEYLHSLWPGMNEMTEWLGMSIDENKEMTCSVVRSAGLPVPADEDHA